LNKGRVGTSSPPGRRSGHNLRQGKASFTRIKDSPPRGDRKPPRRGSLFKEGASRGVFEGLLSGENYSAEPRSWSEEFLCFGERGRNFFKKKKGLAWGVFLNKKVWRGSEMSFN